jgi:hypothetical protein
MSDHPKTESETPLERALRLKKAALASKPHPGAGKAHRRQSAAMAAGASKPAMRK